MSGYQSPLQGSLVPALPAEERDWEAEARAVGWKPLPADPANPQPHEYKGDPKKWTDARTFITTRDHNLGVMRENMHRLTDENRRLTKKQEEMSQQLAASAKRIEDLLALAKDERTAGYTQARRDLEKQKREAIQNGDVSAVEQIEAGLKDIDAQAARVEAIGKAPAPEPAATPTPAPSKNSPAVDAFIEANPWFLRDPVLHQAMISEHLVVIKNHPAMPEARQLETALAALKKRFPTEFGVAAAQPAPAEEPAQDPVEDMNEEEPAPRRNSVAVPREAPEHPSRRRSPFERIPQTEREGARKEYERAKTHDEGLTAEEYVEIYLNPSADVIALRKQYRSKS